MLYLKGILKTKEFDMYCFYLKEKNKDIIFNNPKNNKEEQLIESLTYLGFEVFIKLKHYFDITNIENEEEIIEKFKNYNVSINSFIN